VWLRQAGPAEQNIRLQHIQPHAPAAAGKDQIEYMLAMGASRYEATADLVGRSIRLAMTPLLNTMSVVGLVSIPGMMTGQVSAGGFILPMGVLTAQCC
jgi:ABC-type iron transport system FetAB permease component